MRPTPFSPSTTVSNGPPFPIWGGICGPSASAEFCRSKSTGKLFIVLSIALTLAGCFALNRALVGKWTCVPLLAFPFLFNIGYAKGFLSFNLGFGVMLCAAAWWTTLDESRWRLRLAGAFAFSTLLYVVHFYAWGIYAVFVFGSKLQQILRGRSGVSLGSHIAGMLRDGLQALPALVMMGMALKSVAESTGTDLVKVEFEAPQSRINDLGLLIDVGAPWMNDVLIVCVVAIVAVALLKGWLGFRPGALAALSFCVLLFFVLPSQIFGTAYISWRVALGAVFFAIASLSLGEGSGARRLPQLLAATVLVVVAATAVQSKSWRTSEQGREAFLQLIQDLPEGARLFWAHSGTGERDLVRNAVGLYHVGSYAVIAKSALVQSMFTFPGQQPLRYRDPGLQTAPANSFTLLSEIEKHFARRGLNLRDHILRRFDYVVMHGKDENPERQILPVDRLRLVTRRDDFRLYEIIK